jgi:hypothetical protein
VGSANTRAQRSPGRYGWNWCDKRMRG